MIGATRRRDSQIVDILLSPSSHEQIEFHRGRACARGDAVDIRIAAGGRNHLSFCDWFAFGHPFGGREGQIWRRGLQSATFGETLTSAFGFDTEGEEGISLEHFLRLTRNIASDGESPPWGLPVYNEYHSFDRCSWIAHHPS